MVSYKIDKSYVKYSAINSSCKICINCKERYFVKLNFSNTFSHKNRVG